MKSKLIIIAITALAAVMAFMMFGCSSGTAKSSSSSSTMTVNDTGVTSQAFYVLLVGNDTREGTPDATKAEYADGHANSDVMMLCRVDPANYKITLVSIARDTEITLDGGKTKINYAYNKYGMDGAVQQTELLTGIKVKYWFNTSFVNFENFVDGIDGVTVNVPLAISLTDIVHGYKVGLNAGTQTLDGPEALVLARVRKAYVNQDSTRQYNDRNLVQAFIQKVLDNPSQAASYISTLTANTTTNMPVDELTNYVNSFIANSNKVTFLSGSGPDVGSLDESVNLYLVPRDETTWRKLMSTVNAGGDPNTVYALPEIAAAE